MLDATLFGPSVSTIGHFANDTLCAAEKTNTAGQVVSRFSRSCLVKLGTDVLCIGLRDIGNAPLNCLMHDDTESVRAFNRLSVNDKITVRRENLWVNGHVIGFGRATIWDRCLRPDNCEFIYRSRSRIFERLSCVCALSPEQSLCGLCLERYSSHRSHSEKALIRAPLQDHVDAYFAEAFDELEIRLTEFYDAPQALNGVSTRPVSPSQAATGQAAIGQAAIGQAPHEQDALALVLSRIIGAGAGLTPAGDDFLCGILLASKLCGFYDKTSALVHLIIPLAATHTNALSAQMLRLAALGSAAEQTHDFLDRVTNHHTVDNHSGNNHTDDNHSGDNQSGDQQQEWGGPDCAYCARLLGTIGHSSGWDFAAGVLFAFRIFTSSMNHIPEFAVTGLSESVNG